MNYLERLGAAATATGPVLRPRLPSLFEPDGITDDDELVEIHEEVVAERPRRSPDLTRPIAPPAAPAPAEATTAPPPAAPPAPLEPEHRARAAARADSVDPVEAPSDPPPPPVLEQRTEIVMDSPPATPDRPDTPKPPERRLDVLLRQDERDRMEPRGDDHAVVEVTTITPVVRRADPSADATRQPPPATPPSDGPVVEVRIGHIDIRPPSPDTRGPAAPADAAETFEPLRSGPDLDEYLRTGGRT